MIARSSCGCTSIATRCDTGEELGVRVEFCGVLEGQAGGATVVTRDDERRDLNQLTLTPRGRPGPLLSARQMVLGGGTVSGSCGHDREQGLL